MFIEVAMAMALAPGSWAASPGTIGRNAGSTTADVLLYTETSPVSSATTPVTVPADESRVTPDTIRSMPCARSTSAISTVTPETMMMTRHGISLIASPSSATVRGEKHGGHEGRQPDVRAERSTLMMSAAITPG